MTTVCQVHPILKGISDQPVSLQIPELSRYETGLYNAITDVKGIQVGHVTLIKEGPSPIQTGVTAILPDYPLLTRGEGNSATYGLPAFGDTISGYGEMTGLYAVRTLGVMNSPVILTNTRAVGRAFTGVGQYYRKHFPGLWRGGLPIVGECWDGRFNTINDLSVTEQDVVRALESAQGGPVAQGRIGAGRGMRSFGLHGGMGSASRVFEVGNKTYTLGVLVNSNHGDLDKMPAHIREALSDQIGSAQGWAERAQAESLAPVGQEDGGSIMIIIATDLPLSADQLALLIPRATAGLCVLGSKLSITSGDFVLAFSTARPVPLEKGAPLVQLQTRLNWDELNTVFEATVEAVAEAQLNALVASYAGF